MCHGDKVTHLKRNYSQEDKELIEELVQERSKLRSIHAQNSEDQSDVEVCQEGKHIFSEHSFPADMTVHDLLELAMCAKLYMIENS